MFTFSNFRVLFCSNTETATRNAILGQHLSSLLARIYPDEKNLVFSSIAYLKNYLNVLFFSSYDEIFFSKNIITS
jgi:hypothetical protein